MREYQLFTGSKEIYGQSYRYVDAHNITASATPKGLLCLERMEGGKALVRPLELKLSSGQTIPAASPEFMAAFRRALDRETELRDRIKAIDTRDIGSVNTRLADAKLDIKAIERSYDIREENGRRTAVPRKNPILTDMDDPAGELDRLRAKVEQLNAEYARYTAEAARLREQQGRDSLVYALGDGEKKEIRMDKIVYGYQPNDLGFSGKCGVFLHSLYHFVMDDPREANTEGGIFPAIFGTFIMTLLMSVLVTPVGVIGAIYLREYARQGHLVQAVRFRPRLLRLLSGRNHRRTFLLEKAGCGQHAHLRDLRNPVGFPHAGPDDAARSHRLHGGGTLRRPPRAEGGGPGLRGLQMADD